MWLRCLIARLWLALVVVAIIASGTGVPSPRTALAGAGDPAGAARPAMAPLRDPYVLPLTFEPNKGQVDSRVRFVSHGNGYNVFLTATSAMLVLAPPRGQPDKEPLHLPGGNVPRRVKESVLRI